MTPNDDTSERIETFIRGMVVGATPCTFYFSNREFDHMTTQQFENQCVERLVDDYYNGQPNNGINVLWLLHFNALV